MSAHRNADQEAQHIDYCLNILGIRVWKSHCQLIAKSGAEWTSLGPKWDLPIEIPSDTRTLKGAGTDTLRLTAWQYEQQHPGTDIRTVLSQSDPFETAINRHD
jgi:hypothetical protein